MSSGYIRSQQPCLLQLCHILWLSTSFLLPALLSAQSSPTSVATAEDRARDYLEDLSNTVLVTYKPECLTAESSRSSLISRSIQGSLREPDSLFQDSDSAAEHGGRTRSTLQEISAGAKLSVVVGETGEDNISAWSTLWLVEEGKTLDETTRSVRPNDATRQAGGCFVQERWLKHAGLQVVKLRGACERVGKEELFGRLAKEDCVASRELDSPRYPADKQDNTMRPVDLVVSSSGRQAAEEAHSSAIGHGHQGVVPPMTEEVIGGGSRVDWEESNGGRRLQGIVATDPSFRNQWHLQDGFGVHASQAWDITMGGDGSTSQQPDNTVGVVDFGFMQEHVDLVNRWWVNPVDKCTGVVGNGINEDAINNPHTDDCRGWNFANGSNNLAGYSHGTKVSGCIAAEIMNGEGGTGICPYCRVLPVTVSGSVSSEIEGLNYIIAHDIKVINLSVGGARSEAEYQCFLNNPTVLFVLSAGNENCDLDAIPNTPCVDQWGGPAGYPAALSSELDNVVSVGSIQSDGQRSSFSSYGPSRVQVFAPGSQILTTSYSDSTSTYSSRSGTSYASPIVAGIVGLIRQLYPGLDACQLREILVQSCTYNANLDGEAESKGQVDAYAALLIAEVFSDNPDIFTCAPRGAQQLNVAEALSNSNVKGPRQPEDTPAPEQLVNPASVKEAVNLYKLDTGKPTADNSKMIHKDDIHMNYKTVGVPGLTGIGSKVAKVTGNKAAVGFNKASGATEHNLPMNKMVAKSIPAQLAKYAAAGSVAAATAKVGKIAATHAAKKTGTVAAAAAAALAKAGKAETVAAAAKTKVGKAAATHAAIKEGMVVSTVAAAKAKARKVASTAAASKASAQVVKAKASKIALSVS
eukprot:GHVQ01013396.1.p1 GENE.GHVQ01013396.1~~GHVQ01013396.1.p1  ORF type:complete len:863 (+),score=127.45 GHVQ01013396.1:575-3163(+)